MYCSRCSMRALDGRLFSATGCQRRGSLGYSLYFRRFSRKSAMNSRPARRVTENTVEAVVRFRGTERYVVKGVKKHTAHESRYPHNRQLSPD